MFSSEQAFTHIPLRKRWIGSAFSDTLSDRKYARECRFDKGLRATQKTKPTCEDRKLALSGGGGLPETKSATRIKCLCVGALRKPGFFRFFPLSTQKHTPSAPNSGCEVLVPPTSILRQTLIQHINRVAAGGFAFEQRNDSVN
jgi:hypothetical protein